MTLWNNGQIHMPNSKPTSDKMDALLQDLSFEKEIFEERRHGSRIFRTPVDMSPVKDKEPETVPESDAREEILRREFDEEERERSVLMERWKKEHQTIEGKKEPIVSPTCRKKARSRASALEFGKCDEPNDKGVD